MFKKIFPTILCTMLMCIPFTESNKTTTYATNEGFTATQLSSGDSINVDGEKDEVYNKATAFSVSHVAWENENGTPATATMYMMWDTSYLYTFMEVVDDTHYGYQEGTWLEHRDAVEMIVDLYHNTSYTGGYGGDYRGDKMCEGYYKIAAGVGQAAVDSTIQGTHWMWDDQKNNGSYFSKLTETGYTVEHKIALGKDAAEYMVPYREIGLGVKIYDKHADDKNGSVTVLEAKNDAQHDGPQYLSTVKLIGNYERIVSPSFTATELPTYANITVDGIKDDVWNDAGSTSIDKVRQYYLFNADKPNPSPATGSVSLMFNSNKLYLFAEINDSTRDLNNISAWDAFGLNSYNSYKYHADHLDIYLDIKHNDPTNYDQTWGSAYNDGKDVAAHFELAAGLGNLTYNADGSTGWLYKPYNDGEFSLAAYAVNHSTMYSIATDTGYTFEMVIDLSEANVTDFLVGKTIGAYVGYYDRYETSDASANWGEQSVTTTTFAFDNYLPANGPGWIPEYRFIANQNAVVLPHVKAEAKEELAAYKSVDLYRDAEKALLANAISNGNTAIDGATSIEAIKAALAETKSSIDNLKTDAQYDEEELIALQNAKENAKNELINYKSADLYRDAEKALLANIIETGVGAIEGANTIDAVTAALANAKASIDDLKTDAEYDAEDALGFELLKTNTKAELAAYKSADLYRDAEKVLLANIISTANANIDNATTYDEVTTLLANAKAAIDDLKTDAQYDEEELVALQKAQAKAKEELAAYKSADLYRDAEKTLLANIIANANTAIDNAKTSAAIDSALASAKTSIDELKTTAQYDAEELVLAKKQAMEELISYRSADLYRDAEKVLLASALDTAKTAIESANSQSAVSAALDAAKSAIDQLKTDAQYNEEEAAQALADAKDTAKAELEAYKSVDDYRTAEGVMYLAAIDNGKTLIDQATSVEEVNATLTAVKKAIDEIKTKAQYDAEEAAQALADAKDAAKAELDSYKSLEGLNEEQKDEVATKITEGKAAIDQATTNEEVNTALANAKTALDAIQPLPVEQPKKGCKGSLSGLIGLITLAGALILSKKRK